MPGNLLEEAQAGKGLPQNTLVTRAAADSADSAQAAAAAAAAAAGLLPQPGHM
jgi:hypothetical protein